MELKVKNIGELYSLDEWYYSNKNTTKITYEIFSYWSENGGLEKLFKKLGIKDLKIGESLYFDFDCKSEIGLERDLVEDFQTKTFKIINLQHEYLTSAAGEFQFSKLYNLEPLSQITS